MLRMQPVAIAAQFGLREGDAGRAVRAGLAQLALEFAHMQMRGLVECEFAQPSAQHRVAQRLWQVEPALPVERRRIKALQARERLARLGIDELGRRARRGRRVRERDIGIGPALRQARQDFVAQEIAAQLSVRVARVFDPAQRVLLRVGAQRHARQIEQGAPQPTRAELAQRAHAAEAFRTGTAQQFEQYGLGLVFAMLREREHFTGPQQARECVAPRAPRRIFEPAAVAFYGDAHDIDRHIESLRDCAAIRGPLQAIRVQAVVNVDSAQPACARVRRGRERMQQDARIHAAAEADDECAAGQRGKGGFEVLGQAVGHAAITPEVRRFCKCRFCPPPRAAVAIRRPRRHHARRMNANARTLEQWLDYQQRVHALGVDLGLARVGQVWRRMGAPPTAPVVIAVGGTNGKGSTVAFLEAMLAASGKRVGCYTSPHLLRYNERVRVAGREVDDAALIDAFERIEGARRADPAAPVPLTYFEFGTLAALWIFAQAGLDAAVLEVGLGGRLDAVNIIDADAAIVTTVDLDHQDWLGHDRDAIAREKAGIFRAGRPAIIGDADAPAVLFEAARALGARVLAAGSDYRVDARANGWSWRCADIELQLPQPGLVAPVQHANAAAAIAALYTLRDRLGFDAAAIAAGVRGASVAARLQRLVKAGAPDLIVDVAHNPQAAQVLARWLVAHPPRGRNIAVFGALNDKDVASIVAPLAAQVGQWFVAGLDGETARGFSAADLVSRVRACEAGFTAQAQPNVPAALDAAMKDARPQDRMLAFGSFFVAAAALQWAQRRGYS